MTSKEALEELLYYATLDDSGFEPTMKRYAEVIARDLNKLGQIEDLEEELGLSAYKILERIKEKREK